MFDVQVVGIVREQLVQALDGSDGAQGGIMKGNSWVTENSGAQQTEQVRLQTHQLITTQYVECIPYTTSYHA